MSNLQLSPQEAAQHLLTRRKARAHLLDFVQYTFPKYKAATHHKLIAEKLDAVVDGRIKRLLIFAPPRHGKSELVSRKLPAYFLGRYPDRQVISSGYGDDFVEEFGRDVRNLVTSSEYHALFPDVSLAADSKAKARWNIGGYRGAYIAAGVGGQITGKGAHLLVIDDPVKDRKEANSEAKREDVWNWYRAVAYPRLEEQAAIVLTLTRWHEDDLAGRLLQAEANGGQPWEKISFRALSERGEALWPEKFPREVLEETRTVLGPYEWEALYQGRPAPLEGSLFKPDQIQILDAEPAGVRWVRAWDLAATKDGGAYTAGVKLGKWDSRIVVADVTRLQGSPDEVEQVLVATASRDGKSCEIHLPQDPGQAGKAQIQYLTSKLAGYQVKSSPETGDKVTRASPFASQVNVGNVRLVRGTWNQAYIEELRVFPSGAKKDQVDASSRAFAATVDTDVSWFG